MKRLGLPLLLLSLAACAQLRSFEMGAPIAAAAKPDPAAGYDRAAVLRLLGPPLRMSATAGGYVMAWEYLRVTEMNFGLDFGFAGLESLSADVGRSGADGDFLLLGFDRRHRLTSSHFVEWEESIGGGQGVQAFTGVEVVDVQDLTAPLPVHHWGFGSLERLPVSLNRRSRVDGGEGGIERRGTPSGAGQSSLENP